MKKFLFRLETLLKVRKFRERKLKQDLELTGQKWNQIKAQKQTLLIQIDALMDEIQKQRKKEGAHLQDVYTQILEHLNISLSQTEHTLIAYNKQIEEQKQRLKDAIQERKVIEKIKEKHYASWNSHQSQIEGALLDEIAVKKSAAE